MKLVVEHLPASVAIGVTGWWLSGDPLCLLLALAAGWMIDADHLVDFGWYLKRAGRPVDWGVVKTGRYFKSNNKVFVPLHAWEITITLLVLAAVISDAQYALLSASIAHGSHLIQDQSLYRVRPLGYSLISRFRSRFTLNNFCRVLLEGSLTSNLLSICQRLNRHPLSGLEKLQRESFIAALKQLKLSRAKVLSVSCGDGIWDYLALSSNTGVIEISATDIVDCPVKENDVKLLRAMGQWNFQRVIADTSLPFESNSFDVAFSQDVIEHSSKPFTFLSEQYRVLRKGGGILVGTPNLMRPANLLRIFIGKLNFPRLIGYNEEIGDYVHIQEFHEQQLRCSLEEVGFVDVKIIALYFGLLMPNISFSDYPENGVGRTCAHFLLATGRKPN